MSESCVRLGGQAMHTDPPSTMKISLEINVVIAFIKELSDNPLAKTLNRCIFLPAIADRIQEVEAAPNTCSKKRKQDPSKEGDSTYSAPEELSTPSKYKKPMTNCRNAMVKDPVAVPRRINMANMPMAVSIVLYIQTEAELGNRVGGVSFALQVY